MLSQRESMTRLARMIWERIEVAFRAKAQSPAGFAIVKETGNEFSVV